VLSGRGLCDGRTPHPKISYLVYVWSRQWGNLSPSGGVEPQEKSGGAVGRHAVRCWPLQGCFITLVLAGVLCDSYNEWSCQNLYWAARNVIACGSCIVYLRNHWSISENVLDQ